MKVFNSTKYGFIVFFMGVALVAYLFIFNPPRDLVSNVFESQDFDHKQFSHVHFQDRSKELGVIYNHVFSKGDLKLNYVAPSTSVIDINDDGFMDIFITTAKGYLNKLYINHEGKYFTEEAQKYGLADLNKDVHPTFALWADFNKDGYVDLLLGSLGCHKLLLGNKNHTFVNHSEFLKGFCSRAFGVNTADLYNHGQLDLVFANYLGGLEESDSSQLWMTNVRYDNKTGGSNYLLKNEGQYFTLEKNANFLTRSYTHNAGIADVNMDGLYDIFYSNDFSHDQMFVNRGNGVFEDVTQKYIPKEFHGLSGMNTEFFDYDGDGRIDLYVSNIYKPPFYRSFNLLWKKNEDNTYTNVSTDVGVGRCGFSWGAKFTDVDNDGEADLIVTNGRSRSKEVTTPKLGKSMWYERVEVSQIPRFLRKLYNPHDNLTGRYISAFERKCLFMQKNGKFYDVAPMAGFTDTQENRGLSLIDYDNDGKMDAITSGPLAALKVMHNETIIDKDTNWIGFKLIDTYGSYIPHGAVVTLKVKSKKYVRQLFPANGYKGFNDPRIHIGIGKAQEVEYLDVFWPLTKAKKRYRNLKINAYNNIEEKLSNELL